MQRKRSDSFENSRSRKNPKPWQFQYNLDFQTTDFREHPELYRVGIGEQGVLLVEPYKSEILPHWKFKTPALARTSARKIYGLFKSYKRQKDFVGMDMARKFLQMGYTRSRRYANHRSGQKYDSKGRLLPFQNDPEKAECARIFQEIWQKAESDPAYKKMKSEWIRRFKNPRE